MTIKHVCIVGGAGYVGSALVPKLLEHGYEVTVLDLFLYGDEFFVPYRQSGKLHEVKGDIRSRDVIAQALKGVHAVIHLACVSNDPSFELNPALGKSINYDCFPLMLEECKRAGIKRFIYASSSSVYGVKKEEKVTEELSLEPLTDYSKFKALCEDALLAHKNPGFSRLIIRPATVCGYAPRLRLDLTVNILTAHAYSNRKMTVFGGGQLRPNIHIDDMTDLYLKTLQWSDKAIDGKIYNAGYQNRTVSQIAEAVKTVVGSDVEIVTQPTNDNRSYRVSSEKLERELGFRADRTIEDASRSILTAFEDGRIPNANTDPRYVNIKMMQKVNLQ